MTENIFKSRLKNLPDNLESFTPFPKYECRDEWENAANIELYIKRAEEEVKKEPIILTASDYMRFSRDGNRAEFENAYFSKRRLLTDLVLAEGCEGSGRFIEEIINAVWSICEESAWQLPAHNTYIRDTPQHILPDVSLPVLDLFACETSALLSAVYYVFKNTNKIELELLRKRILHEITVRIVNPYLSEHFWWMGDGDEPMNNWTAWCTQNILLTIFLTPQNESIRRKVIEKSAYSLDFFLKDYGDDGCCNEGAQYYRHAGLCLFGACEVLTAVAKTAFIDVYSVPKIKNIAEYIVNMHVNGPYYINFADCSALAGRCSVREYLFGKAVNSDALVSFAAQDCRINEQPEGDIARINLFYTLQEAFYLKEAQSVEKEAVMPLDIYYKSVGVFVSRCKTYCLAAKAGCNADSHNHNDTGSITLYKNGKPFLIDIGVESYCKKTFSPSRYEIWTMQSKWHNVPTFEGSQQSDGEEFKAENVLTSFSDSESSIIMNLEKAYENTAKISSFIRKIEHKKGEKIIITDEYVGEKNAELTLMLLNKPEVNGKTVNIKNVGEISFQNADYVETYSVEITDPRLRLAWPEKLFYLKIGFKNKLITTLI